jgi:hypothetical protein
LPAANHNKWLAENQTYRKTSIQIAAANPVSGLAKNQQFATL